DRGVDDALVLPRGARRGARGGLDRRRLAAAHDAHGAAADGRPWHRRDGADLRDLRVERVLLRPEPHRGERGDRADLPDVDNDLGGPVPGPALRRLGARLAAGGARRLDRAEAAGARPVDGCGEVSGRPVGPRGRPPRRRFLPLSSAIGAGTYVSMRAGARGPADARFRQSPGTSRSISASQAVDAASEGIRQSPRGESEPPASTFGAFGRAERLNWLLKKRLVNTVSQCLISSRE